MTKILAIAFLLLFLSLGCVQETPQQQPETISVNVSIDDGSSVSSKAVELRQGSTALDAFRQAANLTLVQYNVGAYVSCINGVCEDASRQLFWQYYVDGRLAPVAVDKFVLKKDSSVQFRLEAPNYNYGSPG